MSERGMILAGDVRLGFFDEFGAFQGYARDAINVTELTPTPGEGEERNRVSRMRDTFGQSLDSTTIPEPWTLTLTTDSIGREVLRALFLGNDLELDVASGSATDEAVTARLGKWVPLANQNLSATPEPTATDSSGTPSYVLDTDFLIDRRNGMIMALESGNITEGDEILVSYSFGARQGFRINGAVSESLEVALLLDGRSLRKGDSGKVIRWLAPQVSLRPAGGNDLKSDEWLSPQFNGTLVTPPGENQPFWYEEYTPGS